MTCQVLRDDFEKLVHLVGHPGESYVDVSLNGGTPKLSILKGFSL